MPRPGFILDVESSTPPVLFWRGEQFATEKLPAGARVVYGPESTMPTQHARLSVRQALEEPIESAPLRARIAAATKLSIVVDDMVFNPLPAGQPDVRQCTVEAVLEMAASAGADDVEIVVARGLSRRLTETELRSVLGEQVYEAFASSGLLSQHDAEDSESLIEIGTTSAGEPVEVNKRVAESDLVVFVQLHTVDVVMQQRGLLRGVCSARTFRSRRRAADGQMPMSPTETAEPATVAGADSSTAFVDRFDEVLYRNVDIFQVSAVVEVDIASKSLSFTGRREWEWTGRERLMSRAVVNACRLVPQRLGRMTLAQLRVPQRVSGVFAGDARPVSRTAVSSIYERSSIAVDGQTDVLTFGIAPIGSSGVGTVANPLVVATHSLGDLFALHRGMPLVRQGGALIVHHPLRRSFDGARHPSHIDFFEEVLADTSDASMIWDKYEERYATDSWYRHLYQTSNAYHGLHPLELWERTSAARSYLGGVIVVDSDTDTARRLGFKPASTFEDALEMARDVTGVREPSVTDAHFPPAFVSDVR